MKKNRLFIIGIAVVMVALVSLTLVSNTYAKYTSTKQATASTRVAKWDVKVNNTNLGSAGNITFGLFDTILDSDGTAETDVSSGLIAPGTSGTFTINVLNASEVTAAITATATVTNSDNVPIEFRIGDSGSFQALTSANLTNALALNDTVLAIGSAATTIEVQWQWVFENGVDPADTALGVLGTATVTVAINYVAVQVD